MAVGSINNYNGVQAPKTETKPANAKVETKEASAKDVYGEAAVFEKSSEAGSKVVEKEAPKDVKADKNDRSAIIAQLKADAEARQNQLMEIVRKTMQGQGKALATADDMWRFLASGDFTVDAATKKQAQEDISENGYWGVNQTSDRIVDFAKALSGNDPAKADELLDAFKKGFKEATKTWGKELPDISKQTYDAVVKKFAAWKEEAETRKNNADSDKELKVNAAAQSGDVNA